MCPITKVVLRNSVASVLLKPRYGCCVYIGSVAHTVRVLWLFDDKLT